MKAYSSMGEGARPWQRTSGATTAVAHGSGRFSPAEPKDRGVNVVDVLPCDAIPSIDEPAFAEEYIGDADDDVLVVDLNGAQPRAYPTRILDYHEIVNDDVDGRPVAVTWCPICGSGVVYDACVDGRELTFGVSGKLADDDLVLYDRETGSEWKQSTGEAIAGDLEGERLAVLPAPMTTYGEFREAHPDGVVLQPVEGSTAAARDYDQSGYAADEEREGFGLAAMRGEGPPREWDREDLAPKTVVLGVEVGDDAVGFPRPRVEAAGGVVTHSVGDTDVVVAATPDGIHAFRSPGFELRGRDGQLVGDGAVWDPVTGESDDGGELERVPARRLYAFSWQDDHGPAAFYEG
jgi:hypothetical protein